eukprot:TRINITY_DN3457_c0_g1_i2.p1 TRINITY_DN3457_c0_g1~~TRINITY_DN3457_c0_g1_i2.p1  ORF type:complete len:311 (-),score=74.69 TRINITY_DN3457_c0_g1_i2:118-984(-)
MSGHEQKANEWIQKAEKKLTSFGWFSGNQKYEDAAEYYGKAANLFKMSKQWERAGAIFIKQADCHIQLNSKHEAATAYVSAANCYKKCNTSDAIRCLKFAVEYYTDEGRFTIAAKQQKDIAEICESDADLEGAVANYQTAADYYEGEGSNSAANSCLLKVAGFSAQLEKYDRAIELYEQIASSAVENPLTKWNARDHFLRAGLCHLCSGDVVGARKAIAHYQDVDMTFGSQRECRFLDEIITACEDGDVEKFTNGVVQYDSISKLDTWKTTILLRVKKTIEAQEDDIC